MKIEVQVIIIPLNLKEMLQESGKKLQDLKKMKMKINRKTTKKSVKKGNNSLNLNPLPVVLLLVRLMFDD